MIRIGIDIGGTFTDLVAIDDSGKTTFVKYPSTPEDQSVGVMSGLERLAERLDLGVDEMLGQTERIVHGMTVATNALLERKGARVGLLTSEGHRDVLEMREGLKPERYNLRMPRPDPLVPRRLRLGVKERVRFDGGVETQLDTDSVIRALQDFKKYGVQSVAVCFLHAYNNPDHEQQARALVQQSMPDAYISLSSDVLPRIKEYERVSTTVVNASVGPLIQRYLHQLEARLSDAGYANPLLIILSHGGVAPVVETVRIAAATALSGPAGGLAGAGFMARSSAIDNLITFDMGGTSTDISMVIEGQAALSSDKSIAGERLALPSLDIITLGAGGGSIARVDPGGLLKVGPHSAGAVPGPASYGHGGDLPTVTDASVVLGYIDPDKFTGGRMRLDTKAAHDVLLRLGEALDLDAVGAAAGIYRVVNTQMAEGIRLATVRRGVDPRRFSLLGFGGAAGLHVTELARMLGITRVLIPGFASVLSAWGMLTTHLRYEVIRTHIAPLDRVDWRSLAGLYSDLRRQAADALSSWFDGEIETRFSSDMRYGEQIYEIDVPLDDIDFENCQLLADIKTAFENRHQELYTYCLPDQSPVLVNARVAAVGKLPLPPMTVAADKPDARPISDRRIFLGDWMSVPVYEFENLAAGQSTIGPALVESETTTVLLRPGDGAQINKQGWLDIEIG